MNKFKGKFNLTAVSLVSFLAIKTPTSVFASNMFELSPIHKSFSLMYLIAFIVILIFSTALVLNFNKKVKNNPDYKKSHKL